MAELGIFLSTPRNLSEGVQAQPLLDKTGRLLVSTEGTTTGQIATLVAGTDRSGTVGTTSKTLASANANRHGMTLQNISPNTMGINEFGNAAEIGAPGTYTVPSGGLLSVSTSNTITVIASAADSSYTCTEF